MFSRRLAVGLLFGTMLSTPAFAQNDEREDSGVIVVSGQQLSTESSAGTKSQVPLAETPQSISVIDSEEIAGLGLQNLNQVLRYVAGVTPEQRGASAEVYDQFKLRGFDALEYLDGLRSFTSPSGYAAAQVDMSRLDRVEVVKGPASALYGQSGPGGLVALTSKLPLDQQSYGAIAGTYGNYDLYRVDADLGGKAGIVGWRVYGSANGASTQQTWGKRERETISGAMTIGQGQSTNLTFLVNYSHDPYNGNYGVFPASGTFIENPNGKLPTTFDGGEPGNFFSREQFGATYIFNHDFGSGWGFRSSGRFQDITSKLGIVYTGGGVDASDPTQATFTRASYATDEAVRAWTFDNQLTGKIVTGPLIHNVLVGFDSQVVHSTEAYAFGSFDSINGYNPVYGTAPVPQTPAQVPNPFGGQSNYNLRQRGVYAQDEISLGDLRVTVSGRQDWARVEPVGSAAENSKKFTYRAGALYKTSFGLAPYISYSTSFQPQSGLVLNSDNSLGNAKPSEGKQLEVGAKFQVPGTQILVSGAWFDIDQTNLLTGVQGQPYSIQTGKVNSSGVEVEATAPLPLGFEAKLAFSRQGVKDDAGNRILGVGRGNTTFNLEWAPKQGGLQGFAVGGGVRYVNEVFAGTYFDGITRNTPSYTLFDALARYDLGKLTPRFEGLSVSVNATNVFDKKYLSACYLDYGWCWYGNRRTVQGTIGYRW